MLVGHLDSKGRYWWFDYPHGQARVERFAKMLWRVSLHGSMPDRKEAEELLDGYIPKADDEQTLLQDMSRMFPASQTELGNISTSKCFIL